MKFDTWWIFFESRNSNLRLHWLLLTCDAIQGTKVPHAALKCHHFLCQPLSIFADIFVPYLSFSLNNHRKIYFNFYKENLLSFCIPHSAHFTIGLAPFAI